MATRKLTKSPSSKRVSIPSYDGDIGAWNTCGSATVQAVSVSADMIAAIFTYSAASAADARVFAFAESSAINWLARAIGFVR